MIVETFEIEGLLTETDEERAAREDLILEAGLEGQVALGSDAIPYRKMTKREDLVYSVLCPNNCSVESYSDGAIPLRVLQVIGHARTLPFDSLRVWYPDSADVKDPVLVGQVGPDYGDRSLYILARWGEELESLDTLARQAAEIARGKVLAAYKKAIASATAGHDAMTEAGPDEVLAKAKSLPSFYDH